MKRRPDPTRPDPTGSKKNPLQPRPIAAHLLVFEVDFLGGDAAAASLQLPRPLLQDAQFFISERGRRRRGVFFTLHGVGALEGVVVHHLVLTL